MEASLKFKYVLKSSYFLLFVVTAIVCLPFLYYKDIGNIWFYIFVTTPFYLPGLFLLVEYMFFSYKKKIIFNTEKGILEVCSVNKEETINISDILGIKKICSFPEGENRVKWISSDGFYFYFIEIKDHKPLVVTSLMATDIEKWNVGKVVIEKMFIPTILVYTIGDK